MTLNSSARWDECNALAEALKKLALGQVSTGLSQLPSEPGLVTLTPIQPVKE